LVFRLLEVGEEHLGGATRERAIIVYDKWHRVSVGEEGFVSPLAKVLLPKIPL
jgi:hypothetical protein